MELIHLLSQDETDPMDALESPSETQTRIWMLHVERSKYDKLAQQSIEFLQICAIQNRKSWPLTSKDWTIRTRRRIGKSRNGHVVPADDNQPVSQHPSSSTPSNNESTCSTWNRDETFKKTSGVECEFLFRRIQVAHIKYQSRCGALSREHL